jgi:hypothetical protein
LTQGIRFDWRGNLGRFCTSYLFNHFFREFIPKKAVFEFLNQFSHLNQILTVIYCMPRFFGSFFKILGVWIQNSEAAGHVLSVTYFSNLLEDKDRRFKTNLTISLIIRFNLMLGGYSIWSASLIASRIKEDLTTTRDTSTSQSRCSQGSTQKTPSRWGSGELEDAFRSTRKPAVLDYEELRGLSDPRPRDCAHSVHI